MSRTIALRLGVREILRGRVVCSITTCRVVCQACGAACNTQRNGGEGKCSTTMLRVVPNVPVASPRLPTCSVASRTKALREALAHELADEAYTMDNDNGTTQFIIPVRITIRARDSEMVASNGKWREVRRNAKKIMLSWYKKAVQDTGARDYLEPEMEGWLDHDEEDVVLQRRRGV